MAERRGNDLRGGKSQQLFFLVNTLLVQINGSENPKYLFQLVWKKIQVLASTKVQRCSSVKTAITASIRFFLYTDTFTDTTTTSSSLLLLRQPFIACL